MSEYICPHCRNPIYDDDALLCHFCGEGLHRSSQGVLGRMKYRWSLGAVLVTLVVIAAFVLLMVF